MVMVCSPCATRRRMLMDAARKARAGDLRGAAHEVAETARHMIAHPPKPWHGKVETGATDKI